MNTKYKLRYKYNTFGTYKQKKKKQNLKQKVNSKTLMLGNVKNSEIKRSRYIESLMLRYQTVKYKQKTVENSYDNKKNLLENEKSKPRHSELGKKQ